MSTLIEIEKAIGQLTAAERGRLRERLELRAKESSAATPADRESWLAQLAALRARVASDNSPSASDLWWEDLRGERGL